MSIVFRPAVFSVAGGLSRAAMFWRHVEIRRVSECWKWRGARYSSGYGRIRRGKVQRAAHREAFEIAFGIPVPRDMMVCHSCDNRPCVNPAHLFLGTAADNNADRARKGRNGDTRGERHPQAKLTSGDVAEIRRLRADGMTYKQIAARFSVTPQAVFYAARRNTWGHI